VLISAGRYNEELEAIFADIREEVSSNLRKLLRDLATPNSDDIDIDIDIAGEGDT